MFKPKSKTKFQIQKKTKRGEWQNWYYPHKKRYDAMKIIKNKKYFKKGTVRIVPITKTRRKK